MASFNYIDFDISKTIKAESNNVRKQINVKKDQAVLVKSKFKKPDVVVSAQPTVAAQPQPVVAPAPTAPTAPVLNTTTNIAGAEFQQVPEELSMNEIPEMVTPFEIPQNIQNNVETTQVVNSAPVETPTLASEPVVETQNNAVNTSTQLLKKEEFIAELKKLIDKSFDIESIKEEAIHSMETIYAHYDNFKMVEQQKAEIIEIYHGFKDINQSVSQQQSINQAANNSATLQKVA